MNGIDARSLVPGSEPPRSDHRENYRSNWEEEMEQKQPQGSKRRMQKKASGFEG